MAAALSRCLAAAARRPLLAATAAPTAAPGCLVRRSLSQAVPLASAGAEGGSGDAWHRRRQLLVVRAKERSLEQAVNNIIYSNAERSEPLAEDSEGQILSVLVEDEPGVLSRTASLLSGRGYNIKSLSVYVAGRGDAVVLAQWMRAVFRPPGRLWLDLTCPGRP